MNFGASFDQLCKLLRNGKIVLESKVIWQCSRGDMNTFNIKEKRYSTTFIQGKTGQFQRHIDSLRPAFVTFNTTSDIHQHRRRS